MVVDTVGKSFTREIINALLQQGYTNLAQRLERVAEEGTPTQQKRIPDCWVILHFDIGEGWREDRAIKGFLQVLNELLKVGIDSEVARWLLRGAHDVLTHLVRSPDYTRTEAFCLRFLEAFAPPEVWDLQGVSVPNQT